MNDDGFVSRSLKMSLAASVFVCWFLLALGRVHECASYGIGAAISLGMMWTARYAVVKATSPGRLQGKWFAVTLAVAKYGIAAYVIWHFVHWRHASMLAFAAGVGVTQAVLTMKALGQIMHGSGEDSGPAWKGLKTARRR